MKCPKCSHENPVDAKFCMECGEKLENLCPKCGAKLPPEAKFCKECGEKVMVGTDFKPAQITIPKLEDMHAQLQNLIPTALAEKYLSAEQQTEAGENRPITALFADISGFTPLSNTQTSETMFQLVQDCFKDLVSIVAEYEGSISGFRGDGLLALFGAPILHENDAERAILAGLDMRNVMHEKGLEVSIGINTAMMTVGEIKTALHKEYTAYGTDVNLAKRLQESAKPGQILVGSGTHRLTRRAFDFEIIPDLSVKGFSQPITAYEDKQVKLHPEKLRGIEGLRVRMIGREKEFSELKEAVDLWLSSQGQIVSIVGEAGIGKSRLVSELKAYLSQIPLNLPLLKGELHTPGPLSRGESLSPLTKGDQEGCDFPLLEGVGYNSFEKEEITIPPLEKGETKTPPLEKGGRGDLKSLTLEGRCVSIGQPISYFPFLDILRTYFNLAEDDDPSTIAQKVIKATQEIIPQNADEILAFLGHLMSIRFGNELDDRLKFAAPEQIRHQTMTQLRDFFRAIAEKQPLMLILEDLHWADDLSLDLISYLIDELSHTQLMILCVYRPEKEHKVWKLSDQARRKSLDRYTEIMLKQLSSHESRLLVESLLTIENLPESVKGMILTKSEGNPFFIEEVIRSLIEQGLVYREDDRWKARAEIADIHVPDTIQSVLLARVDRLQAEAKHVLQCASVIGRLFKYRLLEHLTRQEAELDRYISEFEERELIYEERIVPELEYAFKHALTQEATYQSILERRRKEFHHQVAVSIERLYQERLEEYYDELAHHYSMSDDAEKAIEYLLKSADKAKSMFANEYAIHCFNQAISLIEKMPDTKEHKEQKLDALMKLAKVYFTIGQHDKAIEVAEDAIKIAEEISTPRMVARLCYQIADALLILNKFDEAAVWSEKGLRALGDDKICPEAALLNFCAFLAYYSLGNELKSKEYQAKNVDMIRKIGYFDEIYKIYGGIRWSSGKAEDAIAWEHEWIEVCSQHNNQLGLAEGYIYLGYDSYYGKIGTLSESIEYCRKALAIAKRIGYMLFVLIGSYALGRMLIEAGDKIEAEQHLREAVGIMESWGKQFEGWWTVYAYKFLAEILAERGELEQAHYHLVKGLRYSLKNEIQDFLTSLKDSCQTMGKPEEFIAICNAELEQRNQDEEKQIIKNALADFQK
jgi:class 3 adenylate cyclase/tetratricopeptide (TPR) repeat protein/ribosomal protein L40E